MNKKQTQNFIMMIVAAMFAVIVIIGEVFCWFTYMIPIGSGDMSGDKLQLSLTAQRITSAGDADGVAGGGVKSHW